MEAEQHISQMKSVVLLLFLVLGLIWLLIINHFQG